MLFDPTQLRARLTGVRDRIANAAHRAQRDPSAVRLIAVSKTFSAAHVRAAADAGQIDFGENKVQEALGKVAETRDLALRWHLIGHLQSNKARKAAGPFAMIHSVDGPSLVGRLNDAVGIEGRIIDLLVQVDLAGEATKHGVPPEEVLPVIDAASNCRGVRIAGLMTIPPAADDPEDVRPYFVRLRELRDRLLDRGVAPETLRELSMGMSDDFEIAIEEGATIVRVGSAIFGERHYS